MNSTIDEQQTNPLFWLMLVQRVDPGLLVPLSGCVKLNSGQT